MKKGTRVVQVKLSKKEDPDTTLMTYVDIKKGLCEGTHITLKDSEQVWKVDKIFVDSETDSEKLHTDWNNNI